MVENEELSEETKEFVIRSVKKTLEEYKEIFDELDKV